MNQSVFICGPAGCGKTTNAKTFAAKLGLNEIVDGWDCSQTYRTRGVLYLTNEPRGMVEEHVLAQGDDLTVLDFGKAERQWL